MALRRRMLDSIKSYSGDVEAPFESRASKYNAAGQVSDEFDLSGSSILDHYNYSYDASGNLSEEIDSSSSLRPITMAWLLDTVKLTYKQY